MNLKSKISMFAAAIMLMLAPLFSQAQRHAPRPHGPKAKVYHPGPKAKKPYYYKNGKRVYYKHGKAKGHAHSKYHNRYKKPGQRKAVAPAHRAPRHPGVPPHPGTPPTPPRPPMPGR